MVVQKKGHSAFVAVSDECDRLCAGVGSTLDVASEARGRERLDREGEIELRCDAYTAP